MLRLITRRVVVSIPLLLVTSLITFVLESFIPGDAARAIVGANGTNQAYDQVRQSLHLDQSLVTQYLDYLGNAVHGNLGTSLFTGVPVAASLISRLPPTLALIIGSTLVCTIVGVLLGLLGAKTGGATAKAIETVSLLGLALPNFWLGLLMVSAFAIAIPLLPATGYVPFTQSPNLWAASLVLPVVALALAGIANIAKTTRDSVTEAMNSEFVRTLRACGVSESSLLWKHALKNAGVPIVTLVGLQAIGAIAGSLFIENVFALPGLGSLVNTATGQHDIPVIQGVALTYTVIVIVINLITDIAYSLLNPKLKNP